MAISPQTPEHNGKVKASHRLDFPVLSDAGNAYASQLGLTHGLPEDLREVYRAFGIDLPAVNDDDSWTLPLPTRLVTDGAGVVRAIDADPDYTVRPEVEATLEHLRAVAV